MDHNFIVRAVITTIAGAFLLFIAVFLVRSALKSGRRAIKEILRVSAVMVALVLTVYVNRGEVGKLGTFVGFGGAAAMAILSFVI